MGPSILFHADIAPATNFCVIWFGVRRFDEKPWGFGISGIALAT